jgi:hypothetical protein
MYKIITDGTPSVLIMYGSKPSETFENPCSCAFSIGNSMESEPNINTRRCKHLYFTNDTVGVTCYYYK